MTHCSQLTINTTVWSAKKPQVQFRRCPWSRWLHASRPAQTSGENQSPIVDCRFKSKNTPKMSTANSNSNYLSLQISDHIQKFRFITFIKQEQPFRKGARLFHCNQILVRWSWADSRDVGRSENPRSPHDTSSALPPLPRESQLFTKKERQWQWRRDMI